MKKIIKGKRYDTETAKAVGEKAENLYSDLDFWCEKLYQKRTGEFFLDVIGGARACQAGEEIIPLSLERARKWGEDHLSADEYEKVFGAAEEGKTVTSLSITGDQLRKVKDAAVKRKMSVSELIGEFIDLM